MEHEFSVIRAFIKAAGVLRQGADEAAVHGYRIAARRVESLLALWRPLVYQPRLERRLASAIKRLSALRDAQVHALHFGHGTGAVPRVRVVELEPALLAWWQRREEWGAQPQLARLYAMSLGANLLERLDVDGPMTLHQWHRLRLAIKGSRYGVELLLAQGEVPIGWLAELTQWQELLGQLQDRRQWRERFEQEGESGAVDKLNTQLAQRQRQLERRRPVLRMLAVRMAQRA
ncbi:CHAD domain-containing protein [Aeromonas schubertii]|uniref:CHAD domain-containing protein n=1 Tax=Aeromonas schubertii TaxID=652 RepID=UPI0010A927F0|nr:CHAD domain-containing protein [Aeromonas schubertii]QCG48133.1 CHAD domain-containing protein [Aeromonas schubertii]